VIEGNPLDDGQPPFPSTRLTKILTGKANSAERLLFDFKQFLLFPHVPIATAFATLTGVLPSVSSQGVSSYPIVSVQGTAVDVYLYTTSAQGEGASDAVAVSISVDQSTSSATL
jgi:hypothetical protein